MITSSKATSPTILLLASRVIPRKIEDWLTGVCACYSHNYYSTIMFQVIASSAVFEGNNKSTANSSSQKMNNFGRQKYNSSLCLGVKNVIQKSGKRTKVWIDWDNEKLRGGVPMSMTVAPSFTMSACISPGIPVEVYRDYWGLLRNTIRGPHKL